MNDLKIPVIAGYHQYLLEKLGRLRESEHSPRIDPGRDKIIPGPFRCAFGEERRFYLEKTLSVQKVPHVLGNFRPKDHIAHKGLPPQIKVSVFQADNFGHILALALVYGKGRCEACIQKTDLVHNYFYFAGGHVLVDHPLRPGNDFPLNRDDVLRPETLSLTVRQVIPFRIEHNLCEPPPVSEVHKNKSAVIPSSVHPSHKNYFLANIFPGQ